MKITLKQLTLRNFMGIKSLEVPFSPGVNTISGRNATGKTTIFTAFLWLLFGKDSEDRTDFNVKTLNPDGTAIHNLEHEVTGTLRVDDQDIVFKRILKEKWTKPRGQKDQVFSGHETLFYVNEVPCSMREYTLKVSTLCNPESFKLLSNSLYFPSMDWGRQREILFKMAGDISESEVPMSEGMKDLIDRLSGKEIKDYMKEIASKKSKAKDDLDKIPARIDEVTRAVPEILDWAAIEKSINDTQSEIDALDAIIGSTTKQIESTGAKSREIQGQINNIKDRQLSIESETRINANRVIDEAKETFQKLTNTVVSKKREFDDLQTDISNEAANLTSLTQRKEELRQQWYKVNDEKLVFDESRFVCPACNRALEPGDIEAQKKSMTDSFNTNKASRLEDINNQGQTTLQKMTTKSGLIENLKAQVKDLEVLIQDTKEKRDLAEKEIPQGIVSISPVLEKNEEYQNNIKEIAKLEKSLSEISTPSVTEHQSKRKILSDTILELKTRLSKRESIAAGNARIDELKKEQANLAQLIADFEKDEYMILDYTKTRIKAIEERINSMFAIARFKMFDMQVNGQESPTCECTVNGVPFRDLNNGMKITVGVDIINTLSRYFNTFAPIFIDNAEAINVIPETKSQLICLVVTESDKLIFNGQARFAEKHERESITA